MTFLPRLVVTLHHFLVLIFWFAWTCSWTPLLCRLYTKGATLFWARNIWLKSGPCQLMLSERLFGGFSLWFTILVMYWHSSARCLLRSIEIQFSLGFYSQASPINLAEYKSVPLTVKLPAACVSPNFTYTYAVRAVVYNTSFTGAEQWRSLYCCFLVAVYFSCSQMDKQSVKTNTFFSQQSFKYKNNDFRMLCRGGDRPNYECH